jgi:hypothetical protein
MNNFVRHKVGALKDPGVTHGYRLPDEAHLSQTPFVGVLFGEGELPVWEAVEVMGGRRARFLHVLRQEDSPAHDEEPRRLLPLLPVR